MQDIQMTYLLRKGDLCGSALGGLLDLAQVAAVELARNGVELVIIPVG